MNVLISFYTLCTARSGVLLLCCLLLTGASANSPGDEAYQKQELPARSFDASDWEAAKEGIDFSKDMQQPTEEPQPSSNPQDEAAAQLVFKILLIVGGIALLAVLLYYVLTGGFSMKKSTPGQKKAVAKTLEEVEDDLENADPADLLQQAIEQGQYSLAVRLYYLSILRELSLRKIIKWKRDKTNQDYLREARQSAFFGQFEHFTRLFEYIWYGEQAFSQADFSRLQPKLEGFIADIKRQKA